MSTDTDVDFSIIISTYEFNIVVSIRSKSRDIPLKNIIIISIISNSNIMIFIIKRRLVPVDVHVEIFNCNGFSNNSLNVEKDTLTFYEWVWVDGSSGSIKLECIEIIRTLL